MANGGQITLRLSLQGEEQVRKGLASLGPAGKQALAELNSAVRQPGAGLLAINAASQQAQQGLQGLAGRAGPVGAALGAVGPMGLAAAAGIGAVVAATALALNQTRAAMALADEIEDAAAKINIGVESLQEWRYAIKQAGGEATDADAAIGAFTRTLGAAMSNLSPRAMKPFAALGFTKQDLEEVRDIEAFLVEVTRRIAELGSEAERAAVAEKLGLTPLLPLLRQGADEMENLRQKAADLGYVMSEEMVKKGAEAQDQYETLSQILRVQLATIFVELAPLIIAVMQALVDATKAAGEFADDVVETGRAIGELMDAVNSVLGPLAELFTLVTSLASIAKISIGIEFPGLKEAMADFDWVAGMLGVLGDPTGIGGRLRNVRKGRRLRYGSEADYPTEYDGARQGALGSDDAPALGVELREPPKGSGGSRSGPRGPSAAEIADRREELRIQNELNVAEAAGDKARIQALKDELELRRLIKAFKDAGYGLPEAEQLAAVEMERVKTAREQKAAMDAAIKATLEGIEAMREAAKKAAKDQQEAQRKAFELAEARLRLELEIARASGNEAEIQRLERAARALDRIRRGVESGDETLEQATANAEREAGSIADAERVGQVSGWLKGAVKAALDGDLQGFVENWIAESVQSAWEKAIDYLTPILMKLAEQMAQKLFDPGIWESSEGFNIGDVISTIGSAFGFGSTGSSGGTGKLPFAPGRASGGDAAGWIDIHANERLWVPPGSFVMDANRTRQRNEAALWAGMDQPSGGGGAHGPVTVPVTVNNHGEPVRAKASDDGQGGVRLDLYPLVQDGIRRAGRDGTLGRSIKLTPQARRR